MLGLVCKQGCIWRNVSIDVAVVVEGCKGAALAARICPTNPLAIQLCLHQRGEETSILDTIGGKSMFCPCGFGGMEVRD